MYIKTIKEVIKLIKEEKLGRQKIKKRMPFLGLKRIEKIIYLFRNHGEKYLLDHPEEVFSKMKKDKKEKEPEKKEIYNPKKAVKKDRVISKLRNQVNTYKKKYTESLNIIEQQNEREKLLLDLKNSAPKILDIPKLTTPKFLDNSLAFILLSDWHVDQIVDPRVVNELNEFNPEIAEKRVKLTFYRGVNMIRQQSQHTNISGLVLALLGDFISGYLHDENQESNSMSPFEGIRFARDLLVSGIKYILENTDLEKIIIPCSVGNHGRTFKKPRHGTDYKNNFEYSMYQDLEREFAKNDRIVFILKRSQHVYYKAFDKYDIRFQHGHYMKYGGGIGGLSIPINRSIARWNQIRQAYIDCFGHFHTYKDDGKFISNGSLVGYDSYALKLGAIPDVPKQTFFLLHEKYGKTIVAPIFPQD